MKDPSGLTKAAQAAALVTQMTVSTALGAWLGSQLDSRFATDPWLFFAGIFSGFAIGLVALFKGITRLQPPDDDESSHPPQ